eukprot:TRINITY_DN78328_c0_g1_i1.p1 TRINITY_DN78328_c0_g1~~TRINITY_DN78328_c0_g1_i1.p1  ORF type:complete len:265 (+),score=38.18 TRINITY_DN78328_c0_g1_i1:36-797(+)
MPQANDTTPGRIELVIGPMFAGKTTELLRRMRFHLYSQKRCLVIKNKMDTRYNSEGEVDSVVSHNRDQIEAVAAAKLGDVEEWLHKADVIGIDEGQFFPDLKDFAEKAANMGKHVIIAALDGDYKREPFGDVCQIVPLAEEISKLHAICMTCKAHKAAFTRRLCAGDQVELVGGADKYIAVCRACYLCTDVPIPKTGNGGFPLIDEDLLISPRKFKKTDNGLKRSRSSSIPGASTQDSSPPRQKQRQPTEEVA